MANNSRKEKWTLEEEQKFIKRKTLNQKAGLTNAFKNGTKTSGEIHSKIKYLEELAEWTLSQLKKPQWQAKMEEMKMWLKEFERKVNKEYKPSKDRVDEREKV